MPSLSPRRNLRAHMPILPDDIAFASLSEARLPESCITRLPLRSLSLRPGCLLTVPETALSTGFRRSITLPPAVRATRLRALVMVGLLSYRMYLPCLDARWGPIRPRRETGSTSWFRDCHEVSWPQVAGGPLRAKEHGWRQVAGGPLRGKAIYRSAAPSSPLRGSPAVGSWPWNRQRPGYRACRPGCGAFWASKPACCVSGPVLAWRSPAVVGPYFLAFLGILGLFQ